MRQGLQQVPGKVVGPGVHFKIPIIQRFQVEPTKDTTLDLEPQVIQLSDELVFEVGAKVVYQIVDLRTVMPWDRQAVLESARKTSKVLVLHEDTRTGGFGAEIAATIAEEAFEDLDAPVKRVAAPDTPVPFSPPLEKAFIPQVDDVVAGLRELAEY